MNPAVFLVTLSFCLLAFRYRLPLAKGPAGAPRRSMRAPLRARVRLQRANVYSVAAVMALGSAGGWLPEPAQLLLALGTMVVLLLPLAYRWTDREIALGSSRPRAWSEFDSARLEPGRLILSSADDPDLVIWLPRSADGAALLTELRALIRSTGAAPNAGVRRSSARRSIPTTR